MKNGKENKWIGGALLAAVVIFTALSLLFVGIFNLSWWIVPSAILITLGIGYIAYSAFYNGNEPLEYYFGPKDSSYALGWGIILTFAGILLINIFVLGGFNLIILLALLLLVIGFIALVRIMNGRAGGA